MIHYLKILQNEYLHVIRSSPMDLAQSCMAQDPIRPFSQIQFHLMNLMGSKVGATLYRQKSQELSQNSKSSIFLIAPGSRSELHKTRRVVIFDT